jgi:hypothetical protein
MFHRTVTSYDKWIMVWDFSFFHPTPKSNPQPTKLSINDGEIKWEGRHVKDEECTQNFYQKT